MAITQLSAPLHGMLPSAFKKNQLDQIGLILKQKGPDAAKKVAKFYSDYNAGTPSTLEQEAESPVTPAAATTQNTSAPKTPDMNNVQTLGNKKNVPNSAKNVNVLTKPTQPKTEDLTGAVTESAKEAGLSDATAAKYGAGAGVVSDKTGKLVAEQESSNAPAIASYEGLDDDSKKRYAELYADIKKQQTEMQSQYEKIKKFLEENYGQNVDSLNKRRAGQMSEVTDKLSGSGVTGAALANASAEVRNNPALAAEEAKLKNDYVTTLSSQINTFNSILSGLNTNRSNLSTAQLNYARDIVSKINELKQKVTDIKTAGVTEAFKPVIGTADGVSQAASDAEMKTKKSVYDQQEYEKSSQDVRQDRLQDSLMGYGSDYAGFDRSKLPLEELQKAAAMSSFSGAKQYLANVISKLAAAEKAAGASTTTGAALAASKSSDTALKDFPTGKRQSLGSVKSGYSAMKVNGKFYMKDSTGNVKEITQEQAVKFADQVKKERAGGTPTTEAKPVEPKAASVTAEPVKATPNKNNVPKSIQQKAADIGEAQVNAVASIPERLRELGRKIADSTDAPDTILYRNIDALGDLRQIQDVKDPLEAARMIDEEKFSALSDEERVHVAVAVVKKNPALKDHMKRLLIESLKKAYPGNVNIPSDWNGFPKQNVTAGVRG